MKYRIGFISNSSSSSFIIKNYNISERDKDRILNPKIYFREACKDAWNKLSWDEQTDYDEDFENYYSLRKDEFYFECVSDWSVSEEDDHISFYTTMDNFDYLDYIELLGINDKYIEDLDY